MNKKHHEVVEVVEEEEAEAKEMIEEKRKEKEIIIRMLFIPSLLRSINQNKLLMTATKTSLIKQSQRNKIKDLKIDLLGFLNKKKNML